VRPRKSTTSRISFSFRLVRTAVTKGVMSRMGKPIRGTIHHRRVPRQAAGAARGHALSSSGKKKGRTPKGPPGDEWLGVAPLRLRNFHFQRLLQGGFGTAQASWTKVRIVHALAAVAVDQEVVPARLDQRVGLAVGFVASLQGST